MEVQKILVGENRILKHSTHHPVRKTDSPNSQLNLTPLVDALGYLNKQNKATALTLFRELTQYGQHLWHAVDYHR